MKQRSAPQSHSSQSVHPSMQKEIDTIQLFLQNYVNIQAEGKLDQILAQFAPEIVAYDLMPPLMFLGRDSYGKALETYYTNAYEFPVENAWKELEITMAGDMAFCHGLYYIRGTFKDSDEEMEVWYRSTLCLNKRNGKWLITHLHHSVPATDEGQALMDLDPASSLFH
jgi:ketosteroid isomerase-like protein